jgi:hypothetical protein
MATAATYSYISSAFTTGAGFEYPVVMRAGGLNIDDFKIVMEVKDDNEIAIGDLVMVESISSIELEVTTDKALTAFAIVLDTNRNKATLEAAGLTPSKAVQFSDGDKIDILLLVPGMVLSMKCNPTVDILVGTKVATAAGGRVDCLVASSTDEPASKIGYSLTSVDYTDTATESYIAVMVTG